MRIDILTLFPEMCEAVMGESIIGRARKSGKVEINFHQIRDFAINKHNQVDDTPYGGGAGMLMMPQPIYDTYMKVCNETESKPHLIYMSPCGKTLTQERVKELAELPNIAILCGRYEGVDQRVNFLQHHIPVHTEPALIGSGPDIAHKILKFQHFHPALDGVLPYLRIGLMGAAADHNGILAQDQRLVGCLGHFHFIFGESGVGIVHRRGSRAGGANGRIAGILVVGAATVAALCSFQGSIAADTEPAA